MKGSKDLKNIKIAYIGGGSRGWAWQLMRDLATEKEIAGQVALYDIDFEAAKILISTYRKEKNEEAKCR